MTLLLAVAALRLTTVRDTSGVLVMYEPLYPPDGAPLRAFRCKAADCGRVTRTERGMKAHCWLVHHTKLQLELFYDKRETATPRTDGPIQQRADGDTGGVEGTDRAGEETRQGESILPALQGAGTPFTEAPPR